MRAAKCWLCWAEFFLLWNARVPHSAGSIQKMLIGKGRDRFSGVLLSSCCQGKMLCYKNTNVLNNCKCMSMNKLVKHVSSLLHLCFSHLLTMFSKCYTMHYYLDDAIINVFFFFFKPHKCCKSRQDGLSFVVSSESSASGPVWTINLSRVGSSIWNSLQVLHGQYTTCNRNHF